MKNKIFETLTNIILWLVAFLASQIYLNQEKIKDTLSDLHARVSVLEAKIKSYRR